MIGTYRATALIPRYLCTDDTMVPTFHYNTETGTLNKNITIKGQFTQHVLLQKYPTLGV